MATPKTQTTPASESVDKTTGEVANATAPDTGTTGAKRTRQYKSMNGVEYLNKITALSVMGEDYMKTKPEAQEDMFTLIGLVQKAELNSKSQYGDSFKFKGSFKAVRATDKVQFTSGALYLPRALEDIMAAQIQSAQGEDEDDVQFVVIIGRKPSKKGSMGYEYTFKPVLQVVQYDPLEALEQAANSALQLSGPQDEFTKGQLKDMKS